MQAKYEKCLGKNQACKSLAVAIFSVTTLLHTAKQAQSINAHAQNVCQIKHFAQIFIVWNL